MKLVLSAITAITVVSFFGSPGKTLAGLRAEERFGPQGNGSDALFIYASGSTLDRVINTDTTSTGQQAHSVYELVSLDTTYIYLGQISPREDITVLGVLGSDGRPPCIQPGVLNDGSTPNVLFNLNRSGLVGTFKNLYVEDLSTNGSYTHPNYDIKVSADSVKLYIYNVVFDYNHGSVIGYTGNWDDFHITNSKFRNGVDPVTWTDTEILAPLWPATPAVDSVVMDYNTFFCDNAWDCVAKPPVRYVQFDHNNVVFSYLEPLWIYASNSATVDNNIFYAAFVAGRKKTEYPLDQMSSSDVRSIIDFDTMDVNSDEVFDPADAGKSNWRMLAEAKRTVEVENNDFYEPAAVTNFWTEWDDTAKGADSLYTASWMNARTTHMFNDPTDWPGFKESENMIGTDPGYGASFANVFQGGSNYGIGLLKYFTLIRTLQSPTVGWGYQIPSIPAGTTNWIPDRPLPEAADMQYRNAALMSGGTDGKPLGDPGWFTGGYTGVKQHSQTVPTGFILSNNYPNPFNPSTVIKVSLNRSGAMSLRIYNVLGQQVKVVDQGNKAPGEYIYGVNMDNFASGVYFYTLEQRPNIMTKKMLLLK